MSYSLERNRSGLDLLKNFVSTLMDVDINLLDANVSLIEQGLDSVSIMKIPMMLKEHGYSISLKDLLKETTLRAWFTLMEKTEIQETDAEDDINKSNVNKNDRFPLTHIQEAYIVGRRDDQDLGGVGCHLYSEFDGFKVDPIVLENAVLELCKYHPMLRARFYEDGYQKINSHAQWQRLEVHDFSKMNDEVCAERLLMLRDHLSHRRLKVLEGEVFDVQLSKLPGGATRIHINIDLLVADVLSITIFLRDLANLYNYVRPSELSSNFDFHSYCVKLSETYVNEAAPAKKYWSSRLQDLPTGPKLPLRKKPFKRTGPTFQRRQFRLSTSEINILKDRARSQGVTLAATLATAFSLILGKWSENSNFLLNVPLFNRKEFDRSVADMIADFTSLVLVEVDVSVGRNFIEHAKRLQYRMHTDIAHSAYSGLDVLRDLKRLDFSHSAPVVFACNFNEPLLTSLFENTLGQLGWAISQTPQVWLDHQIYRLNDGYLLNWDSNDEIFPSGLLDGMFSAYESLVRSLVKSDWSEIQKIDLPPEQISIRSKINNTDGAIDQRLLHEPFLLQAKKNPDSYALKWATGKWSYKELYDQAAIITGALLKNGVQAGAHVAVVVPKTPDQIAAVLGVLMAGAIYVPIAADSPPDRLKSILLDAQCHISISTTEIFKTIDWPSSTKCLVLDSPDLNVDPVDDIARKSGRTIDDIAYLIYTSGSTGTPKGVMIDHRGALNTVLDVNKRWGVTDKDRLFGLSSLTFDLSVYDIFGTLSAGATLILPDENGRKDPAHWYSLIDHFDVTVWNSVPALMVLFVEYIERRNNKLPPSLRNILLSGDWIPITLPGRLKTLSHSNLKLVGLGGATEASIWSNWYDIGEIDPEWSSIPYGYPLTNQKYHILDFDKLPCPDWVEGDLYISGVGLAHGYWRDEDKTNSSFFYLKDNQRVYRTGDRAKYWPGGMIEFLGRRDHQVKIAGHRIELGEVDAALMRIRGVEQAISDTQILGVQNCVVSFVKLGCNIDQTLIKELRTIRGASPDNAEENTTQSLIVSGELKKELSFRLPAYMIPRVIYILEDIPLTPNGKIDRSKLPDIKKDLIVQEEQFHLDDKLNNIVHDCWAACLNIDHFPREANFFDLGGDSLLAIRLMGELSLHLKREYSVRLIYESPIFDEFINAMRESSNKEIDL